MSPGAKFRLESDVAGHPEMFAAPPSKSSADAGVMRATRVYRRRDCVRAWGGRIRCNIYQRPYHGRHQAMFHDFGATWGPDYPPRG